MDINYRRKPVKINIIEGSDIEKLSSVPAGSYVSGTITVNVCPFEIKNSDYVKVEKGLDSVSFSLTYANPQELSEIISINKSRKAEIERLRTKLCSYQINLLTAEERTLKSKISSLKRKGFYANYYSITSLNNKLKKTKSKLGTLELNVSSGADQDTLNEIDKLDKGFKASYKVFVYTM